MKHWVHSGRWLLLFGLLTLACGLPSLPSIGSGGGNNTATPTPLPTPAANVVLFQQTIPLLTMNPGDTLPGTQLTYLNRDGNTYNFTIDGFPSGKQIGDGLSWRGVVAPGVTINYSLRIISPNISELVAATGVADIYILDPNPQELPAGSEPTGDAQFNNLDLLSLTTIPAGSTIPGTTLVYVGQTSGGLVELSGTTQYPYYNIGDSLTWTGQLRNNVHVRYTWRIAAVNENGLSLTGFSGSSTTELWVTTGQ